MPIFVLKLSNTVVTWKEFQFDQSSLIIVINLISFTELIQQYRAW